MAKHSTDELVWSFGIGWETCANPISRDDVRASMSVGDQARGETPARWTLSHALPLATACPQQLDGFYASVIAAGHADAAASVRNQVTALLRASPAAAPTQ